MRPKKKIALALAPAAVVAGLWVGAGPASAGMCMDDASYGPADQTTCVGSNTFAAGKDVTATTSFNSTATATGNGATARASLSGTATATGNEATAFAIQSTATATGNEARACAPPAAIAGPNQTVGCG